MTQRQVKDKLDILKKYWGYDKFRDLQEEIIDSVLAGRDTLGLMPTGGGKSITFQVPVLATDGMALVITPIISLMKDQVDNLIARGIKATYLHAGLTRSEVKKCYDKCRFGNCKFLYVSPERLNAKGFIEHLKQMPITLIVVDEAHCISQWGYDFRPSFLRIAKLRKIFPLVPILALTATATPEVVADIMDNLAFRERNVFSKSFARDNIVYVVRDTSDKERELVHIMSSVYGTGIVYVRSRKKAKHISDLLNGHGIGADYYHAGLSIEEKESKQQKWKNDECRIMVATNAFGMGIDKPDVRIVVHVDVPNSIEEYYQEAGRAGRDGKRAFAVQLTAATDKRVLNKHLSDAFPDKEFIRNVYELLCVFLNVAVGEGYDKMFDFNFNLFCKRFNLPILPTHNALKILTQAQYIEFIEEIETQSRVMIHVGKNELYDLHTTTPGADKVLQAILRLYTGLFSDYVFINEAVISMRTGLSEQTIYEALLEMTRMHILHYVPRKRTPYIIFTTSREETKHVKLPRTIYEDLRKRMEARIDAVIEYISSHEHCREWVMLRYFGEKVSSGCGHCDVCIDRKKKQQYGDDDVRKGITYMAGLRPRTLAEFVRTLSFTKDDIVKMLRILVDEGYILYNQDNDTFMTPSCP